MTVFCTFCTYYRVYKTWLFFSLEAVWGGVTIEHNWFLFWVFFAHENILAGISKWVRVVITKAGDAMELFFEPSVRIKSQFTY